MSSAPQPDNDNTVEKGDREYSAFGIQHRLNFSPVDEAEEDRLESQNRILRELLDNRIVFPPFPPAGVEEPMILDCGFGKGHWLDDILEEYGPCEATGIDINIEEDRDDDEDDEADEDAPDEVQEYHKLRWNLNASLRGSGLEPRSFDLINSRCVAEGIGNDRWTGYIKELWTLLKPGGYLQMVEMQYQFQSDAGRPIPRLEAWNEVYKHVLNSETNPQYRRNPRAGGSLVRWLRQAGFESIQQIQNRQIPIGDWKAGQQQLGVDSRKNIWEFLQAWSRVAYKDILGMSDQHYSLVMAGILSELRNPQLRLYFNVYATFRSLRRAACADKCFQARRMGPKALQKSMKYSDGD